MKIGVFVAIAVLLTSQVPAMAAPVQWSGNGHWYEAVHVAAGITWNEASAAAEAEGGYLATVVSAEENTFVFDLISDPQFWFLGASGGAYSFGPWLGGFQYDNAAEPDGHWRWVTDEPWGDTNWAQDEPNNAGGNEDYLHYYTNDSVGTLTPGPTWNDAPLTNPERGYVIEWPYDPQAIGVQGVVASRADWLRCHPNPSASRTTVSFTLPHPGRVHLVILDVSGHEIARLVDEVLASGVHSLEWTGMSADGRRMPSGTYFCRLTTPWSAEARKVTLIR